MTFPEQIEPGSARRAATAAQNRELVEYARHGHLDLVKRCIAFGAVIEADDYAAIRAANEAGHTAIADWLHFKLALENHRLVKRTRKLCERPGVMRTPAGEAFIAGLHAFCHSSGLDAQPDQDRLPREGDCLQEFRDGFSACRELVRELMDESVRAVAQIHQHPQQFPTSERPHDAASPTTTAVKKEIQMPKQEQAAQGGSEQDQQPPAEGQEQGASKKKGQRPIITNEDRDRRIPASVAVWPVATRGSGENTWEVYPVLMGEKGREEQEWFDMPATVAGVTLSPEQVLTLAEGYHVQVPKPPREGQEQSEKPRYFAFQAELVRDKKESKTEKGKFFDERKFKVYVGDAIYRAVDTGASQEPVGFNIQVDRGDKKTGVKAKYATIWRSPWRVTEEGRSARDCEHPDEPVRPLSLREVHAVAAGVTVTRETTIGPIQIAMKDLKPGRVQGSFEVELAPFQPQQERTRPSRQVQQDQPRGRRY